METAQIAASYTGGVCHNRLFLTSVSLYLSSEIEIENYSRILIGTLTQSTKPNGVVSMTLSDF